MNDAVTTLDEFEVVAIDGKGIWITDKNGNGWHVGTPSTTTNESNKLAQAYEEATSESTD